MCYIYHVFHVSRETGGCVMGDAVILDRPAPKTRPWIPGVELHRLAVVANVQGGSMKDSQTGREFIWGKVRGYHPEKPVEQFDSGYAFGCESFEYPSDLSPAQAASIPCQQPVLLGMRLKRTKDKNGKPAEKLVVVDWMLPT